YTRCSTVVWTAFFVVMAAASAALAVLATPQIWSVFTNGIDYLLVGALFVGEYVFRRVRYGHHEHRPLADVVRTVARAGKLRPPRLTDLWRHHFTFATTVLDRVYFVDGRFADFDIEVRGLELLRRTLAKGRGCLLLGAHLGSFELLRTLALEDGLSVNSVMYE